MVVHTCNPSAQEAEAGGSRVQGQPGLHSETCLKKKKKIQDTFSKLEDMCDQLYEG
jgi:hypothetical protein